MFFIAGGLRFVFFFAGSLRFVLFIVGDLRAVFFIELAEKGGRRRTELFEIRFEVVAQSGELFFAG